MSYYCWRCARRLYLMEAPVNESVKIMCHKCKAPNIVRAGHDPAEAISLALDSTPPLMLQSKSITTS